MAASRMSSARCSVQPTDLNQLQRVLLVRGQALALDVRSMSAVFARTCRQQQQMRRVRSSRMLASLYSLDVSITSAAALTLVEVEACPAERGDELLDCAGHETLLVRVLDAKDEGRVALACASLLVLPLLLLGEPVVVQCGAQTAQVEGARGGRSVAHSHRGSRDRRRGGSSAGRRS